ncbi:MAG: hypothetical protein ACK5UE_13745 [Chitinophagales bacterium]|jgi:hypothetical protein
MICHTCQPIHLPPPSTYSILSCLGFGANDCLTSSLCRGGSPLLGLSHISSIVSFIVYRVVYLSLRLIYIQNKPQVITSEKAKMTHGGAYTLPVIKTDKPVEYPTGFV